MSLRDSMTKQVFVLVTALCLLVIQGCYDPRPYIHGGSEEDYPQGRLTILQLKPPDSPIVVAVKFPKPIDESWHPGFGHSGNGEDVTQWEDVEKVRFDARDNADVLTVAWKYFGRTRRLLFAGRQFDLPQGKVAVLGYNKKMEPTCELRNDLPKVVEQLRKELGAKYIPSLPALAAPAP